MRYALLYRISLIFIGASIALSGCAVGPDYVRPDVATPERYKEEVGRLGEIGQDDHWWTLFNDTTLDDLASQVEVSNQNLAASAAAYREASAVTREQRAALFPSITIGVGATVSGGAERTRTSGGGTAGSGASTTGASSSETYQAGASAGWEIDLWGRLRRQIENARALADASADDLAFAKLSIQGQLATAYLQLREADAELRLVADTVTAYARALQIAQNRYAAGVAVKTDVLQAQTQLANAQDQATALTLQRAQLEHAIAALVGKAASDFTLAARDDWNILVPDVPTGVPSALLQRRPDIAAAERRIAAANATIGVQEAAYFPSLTLTGTYDFLAGSVATLFSGANESHAVAASVAQTLFDAGATSARVAQARAAHDQAVALYRQSVIDAFKEVEDQLASTRLLVQQYEFRRQASAAADETERLTMNQYRAGTISYTNVVVAQTAALSARRALATIAVSRQTAAVALIAALGGGWNPLTVR